MLLILPRLRVADNLLTSGQPVMGRCHMCHHTAIDTIPMRLVCSMPLEEVHGMRTAEAGSAANMLEVKFCALCRVSSHAGAHPG